MKATNPVREAVYAALEDLDVRSSVHTLQVQAGVYLGSPVGYQQAVQYRLEYRKLVGKQHVDCTTNAGQPRRDMRNDNIANTPQLKRLARFFQKSDPTPAQLRRLLEGKNGSNAFHSIPQLANACKRLKELQYLVAV